MRNLTISSEISVDIKLQLDGEKLLHFAFDAERSRSFFASSANFIYSVQFPSPSQKGSSWSKVCSCLESDVIDLDHDDSITALDYLIEKEALVIGTSSGSIVLYIVDSKILEIVGNINCGVKHIVCSPDGSLLAVTSGSGQLLILTLDWEVFYETPLDPQNSEDVGGSADNKYYSSICWRGDGKFFAILGGSLISPLKEINVWERETGMFHATSGSKRFMGSCLDWNPSGSKLVAAYDRKAENEGPLIVFFEKNGLERSFFALDDQVEAIVESIKWNCSSDLLAVKVSHDDYDAIKILFHSNNHWYLKQELRYMKNREIKFSWDPVMPLRLLTWTLDGKITTCDFVWETAVTESSIALVIDNSNVLVSSLALSLMPPPIFLFKLAFPCAVQNISFLSKNMKSYIATYLSNGSLSFVEFPSIDTWEQLEDTEVNIKEVADVAFSNFMHLTFIDSHTLLGVTQCDVDAAAAIREQPNSQDQLLKCSLCEIELVNSEISLPDVVMSSGWHAKISKRVSFKERIIGITPIPLKKCSAFLQMEGGPVLEYPSTTFKHLQLEPPFQDLDPYNGFMSSCPLMRAIIVSNQGVFRTLLFGLDEYDRLHVGKRILCNDCSSFSFYSSSSRGDQQVITHLVFNTKHDFLYVIGIDDILHGNSETDVEKQHTNEGNGENSRAINIWEKGAKLLGVIHGDEAAVIMQPPRGNLECIYPRELVLESITNALIQRRFRDAFVLVRRHRIDFNIIVDYCGSQIFLESVEEFVSQVNNLSHITDFICALKNENVMNTLYKAHKRLFQKISDNPHDFVAGNKVSSILRALQKALEKEVQENPSRELCILTTLARNEPPALEEALQRVKVIREMEIMGIDDARRKKYPSAEESLKHLIWLTDPKAVYEAALGLYDLNLAAIVALNSQKDPKEFIPFLKELEQLPSSVMRYTIDVRLHRLESALKHIISAGDEYYEVCLSLMKKNPQLFPLGLELITDCDKRSPIMEAWGDHLESEKCFEDAAEAYICCSLYQKALKAYRSCGDWKGVFTVAGVLGLGKEEVHQLALELCDEFQAVGKPSEAAKLVLDYCGDISRGVSCFVMAHEWEEALRIGYMHSRQDLVSNVQDAALDCAHALISEFKEGSEKVGKYVARYLAVRQRRLVLAAKLRSEDKLSSDGDYDNVSEVSTSCSSMSAYMRKGTDSRSSICSSITSKAHLMKHQKKKGGKIRAGSPGEEMALVEHLKGMRLTACNERELKSLIRALLTFREEATARQLGQVAERFVMSLQAAANLAEDTIDCELVDENIQTLDYYLKKTKASSGFKCLSWQSKILST